MAKKEQHHKKHNLNKKKGTRIIILILALSFVVIPLITLVVYLINLMNHPFI